MGMTSSPVEKIDAPDQTVLVGGVAGQTALIGVMKALNNSGPTVVSVKRLRPVTDPYMDDAKKQT
jgi:hypothetical protein